MQEDLMDIALFNYVSKYPFQIKVYLYVLGHVF